MSQQHAFQRTDRSALGLWWWTTDHLLLGATAVLIMLGVILQFGTSRFLLAHADLFVSEAMALGVKAGVNGCQLQERVEQQAGAPD